MNIKTLLRTVSNNILHEITFLKEKYSVSLTCNYSNVEIHYSKVTQSARPCDFLVRLPFPLSFGVDVLTKGLGNVKFWNWQMCHNAAEVYLYCEKCSLRIKVL